jgi:hypothetical protein
MHAAFAVCMTLRTEKDSPEAGADCAAPVELCGLS